MGEWRSRGLTALRLGLLAVAAASFGVCLSYLFFVQSDSFKATRDKVLSTWVIPYKYGKALKINQLDSKSSQAMIFTWLTILVASLFALAYRNVPKGAGSSCAATFKAKVRMSTSTALACLEPQPQLS